MELRIHYFLKSLYFCPIASKSIGERKQETLNTLLCRAKCVASNHKIKTDGVLVNHPIYNLPVSF